MTKLLCKLFRFFLNLFEQTVEVVARALKSVGNAVVDVLDNLWDATLGGSSGLGSILKWGVIGLGAYLLIGLLSDDDDDKRKSESSTIPPQLSLRSDLLTEVEPIPGPPGLVGGR